MKKMLLIEMKRYCMERSTIFTFFCHFRNFIVSQLHFKLYGSDVSIYLFFFFLLVHQNTHLHTQAHTWRVTQHSWDCTFVFLESRSCFIHTLTITINTRTILCYWYAVCLMRYFHVWTVWNLLKTAVTECLRFSWTQWVIMRRF